MNIIILLKQVYDIKDVKLKVNPFDLFALEAALTVKDQKPEAKVIVLSMGTEQTTRCLIEGLAMGADEAYHLNVNGFFDTVAAARHLAEAINKIEKNEGMADIIITGSQSTDSGSGILPYMLSHITSRKLVPLAAEISLASNNSKLQILKRVPDGFEETEESFPLILSATKPNHEVRYPTFKRIREANRAQINVIEPSSEKRTSAAELVRVTKPGRQSRNSIVRDDDAQAGAQMLLRMLQDDKIF